MNLKRITFVLAAIALLGFSTQADARRYGGCDGIHRCRCGSTQTAHFGLPRNYNGHNLWRAVEWIKAFPRTDAHAGAVGYVRHGGPSGHVFRVVQPLGNGKAVVADDKGTYTRNISNATFVDPNGNGVRAATSTMHAKAHKHKYAYKAHRGHYRVATAAYVPPDRLTASH